LTAAAGRVREVGLPPSIDLEGGGGGGGGGGPPAFRWSSAFLDWASVKPGAGLVLFGVGGAALAAAAASCPVLSRALSGPRTAGEAEAAYGARGMAATTHACSASPRDCLLSALLRALSQPQPALLLVPASLRAALPAAVSAVAALLEARGGGGGGAGGLAGEPGALAAALPPRLGAADFERVAVRYVRCGAAAAPAAAAPPAAPDVLLAACHLHLAPAAAAPRWVCLVAPERTALAPAAAADAAPPAAPAAGAGAAAAARFNAALALLAGAGAAAVHVQFLGAAPPPAARAVLARAARAPPPPPPGAAADAGAGAGAGADDAMDVA